ncbi:PTS mannose/fructose/sorbose transporter subunit IIB [Corallococcus praedator]|uniref:PTS mannose/fructose/sorbose transporter subunit IIB n=1 Tax=Corallococcus praedator TaxID=2316724 RepID=A0ABX9QC69_9BACT|nr:MULTISPECIES: PTS sugar transporter subunit IIB [Corallococcus]RKH13641.1 PTS mannose/fructose/sorbose transporter subunit IIB [Corallococcus sp. CA047B]RKH26336.1 PTS mannose/fructose/sorbose transporter subunit IIB [Corallococcus sp. CA031C]RKI01035.1 PTS mannose/fructose/sorbose transporter subunit IIB [Corallococcus praedator]RYZ37382.1 MAG: PTS mannose/fructose/sorbose transporter subunit IIB [Myxococcaceae bacterium]
MITLVRVDNRLIHGQVVEAWLPHLKVSRVVVADDEAASSPLIRAAMALAVQSAIEVQILPLAQVDFAALSKDGVRTLVLLRDVSSVPFAFQHGLVMDQLNLGNVHFGTGRRQVSPSVFLAEGELQALQQLSEQGVRVEARAVPAEKSVDLPDLTERWSKAG